MPQIDALFDDLLARKGSDLHLGTGYPPLARVDGELVPLREPAMTPEEIEALLFEIASPAQKTQILEELDLDFAYAYGTRARFRANYFHRATGLAAVFRTIPTKILTLDQLGTPDVVRKLSDRRTGLVLVTGPTGSGKSTTLAAMLNHINRTRSCHILTIEDPIEFVHEPIQAQITHREIGVHAPSFPAAMRSAGREDPDVVLVGELRGAETMKLALQLASFGVLVFATVHTNSASATIDRILNAFPADEQPQIRGMLAESLAGIIAQQLLPREGGGRVAVLEILLGTSAVSAMIREGKTFQIASVMQASQAAGMQTTDLALERLLEAKKIRGDVALDMAVDKEAFQKVVARLAAR